MAAQASFEEEEQIALFFSCRKLTYQSPTDFKCNYLILKEPLNIDQWKTLGRTEVVQSEDHPDFTKQFQVFYIFEARQPFKVELYQVNQSNTFRHQQDIFIGEAEFELADIAGSLDNLKALSLYNKQNESVGKVIIRMEALSDKNKYTYLFNLSVLDVPAFHFFSSKNCFLKFYKQRVSNQTRQTMETNDIGFNEISNQREWVLTYQTKNQVGDNAHFGDIEISGSTFCYNNVDLPVKIELYKYKQQGKSYLMGNINTKLSDIVRGQRLLQFKLTEEVGFNTQLIFNTFRTEEIYDFVDFIKGGLGIDLVIGIDFTASNKDPTDPNSLHFFSQNSLNLYQKAILSVGEIIQKYLKRGQFAAYGFGAKIGQPPQISHFFPMSLNFENPFFPNIETLFQAYKLILNQITFSGPTHFAPLIEKVLEFSQERYKLDKFNYTVLVILTDGVINDLQLTIDQIVKGCYLPLSIIIIGIGNENFKNMEILDADEVPMVSSWNETMKRDIVQFVPFNKFQNNPMLLREEVLEEIPMQIVSFYKMVNVRPNPPKQNLDVNRFESHQILDNNQIPSQERMRYPTIQDNLKFK